MHVYAHHTGTWKPAFCAGLSSYRSWRSEVLYISVVASLAPAHMALVFGRIGDRFRASELFGIMHHLLGMGVEVLLVDSEHFAARGLRLGGLIHFVLFPHPEFVGGSLGRLPKPRS